MHGVFPEVLWVFGTLAALAYFGSFAVMAHVVRRRGGRQGAGLVLGVYLVLSGGLILSAEPSWRGIALCASVVAGLAAAAWRIATVHTASDRAADPRLEIDGLATVVSALGLSLAVFVILLGASVGVNAVLRAR